jgi:hypothetical protein
MDTKEIISTGQTQQTIITYANKDNLYKTMQPTVGGWGSSTWQYTVVK